MSCSAGECGRPEPYRAAQARAAAAIRRQILSCDLLFCREGHGTPLAPSARTRSKAAPIHYQSNNHAIPSAPSRACPISRKKIVKTLLNLAMSGPLNPKICLNADFPVGTFARLCVLARDCSIVSQLPGAVSNCATTTPAVFWDSHQACFHVFPSLPRLMITIPCNHGMEAPKTRKSNP